MAGAGLRNPLEASRAEPALGGTSTDPGESANRWAHDFVEETLAAPRTPNVNPVGGSGDPNRDSWCTPRWLTDIIGPVSLDPCSNPRSTVRAERSYSLEAGQDGLAYGHMFNSTTRTFINPGYSRGTVLKWVRNYLHTDFIFLCRWDPSTEWFALLMLYTTDVWFPDRRIDFVPPPGVKSSSNPYPHALFFRSEAPARFHARGYLLSHQRPVRG